jgi:hypothetical protein
VHASNVQAALHGGESPRVRVSAFVTVKTSETIIFRDAHSIEFEVPSEKAVVANLSIMRPVIPPGEAAWLFDHQECFKPG